MTDRVMDALAALIYLILAVWFVGIAIAADSTTVFWVYFGMGMVLALGFGKSFRAVAFRSGR